MNLASFLGVVLIAFVPGFTGAVEANSSPQAALEKVRAGKAIVLDVRETDELTGGKVKEAQVFHFSKFKTPEWDQFVKGLPKDKEIYIYCARGGRAGKVAEVLRENGFSASNTGGYSDWVKAGAKSN